MASDITTLDEAEAVHRSAIEAIERGDYDTAHGLLMAVYESGEATGELAASVCYRLGEIYFQADDFAMADRFYNEAYSLDRDGRIGFDASVRLAHIAQRGDARIRTADRTVEEDVKGTTGAAWNLLVAKNYDAAAELYLKIYEDPDLAQNVRAAVALDLGRCYIGLADYATARQWLEWATQFGGNAEEIDEEVAKLDELEAARAAVADGANAGEMLAIHRAADAAYYRGDATNALELWSTILQNPGSPPELRAVTLFNVGQAHVKLGDNDTARAYFGAAAETGDPRAAAGARERLDMLDRLDDALQEAGLLEPDETI